MNEIEDPDRVDAEIQWINAQILMREINKIEFMERLRALAPGVAVALKKAGVIFP